MCNSSENLDQCLEQRFEDPSKYFGDILVIFWRYFGGILECKCIFKEDPVFSGSYNTQADRMSRSMAREHSILSDTSQLSYESLSQSF